MAVCISNDLLKQFTDLIPQIPTLDSLAQPVGNCTPDIANLLNSGTAFANPLSGGSNCIQLEIQSVLTVLNSLSGLTGAQTTTVNSGISTVTNAATQLTGFDTHTNGLITSLPQNMGTVLGCIRSRASLGSSLPVNPCKLMDDVMGTILGAGAQLLNSLGDALAPIVAALLAPIAALVAVIASALAPLANAIAAIVDQLLKETKALTDIFQEVSNFSFANAIANQANDPCLQAIFNAVGTPNLLECLVNNLPGFNIF